MSAHRLCVSALLIATNAAIGALCAGCGPAATHTDGPASFEIGTGSDAFAAITDGESVTIAHGQQGGIHVWVAGHVTGLGDPIDVKYGLRDADTGESVSYLSLESMVHLQSDGDADAFTGLTARFAEDDATMYDGRRLVLWAEVTGKGETLEDERVILVKAE
jgi:hypothetical protein